VAEGSPATRIMIFLSEDDRVGRRGLPDLLLERARDDGLAGATLWRGTEGFGRSGHVRTDWFPDGGIGLPLALEIIDEAERIEAFLPTIQRLAPHSFVTREVVETQRFSSVSRGPLDDPEPKST
jgi:uncharacterized protein